MQNLRALRRSRSLTFLDLATLTGIPARQIAEVEYGLRRLTAYERESLALVLGLPPAGFTGAHRRPTVAARLAPAERHVLPALVAAALSATLATGALLGSPELSLPAPRASLSAGLTGAPAPAEPAARSGAAPSGPPLAAGALHALAPAPVARQAAALVQLADAILKLRAALPEVAVAPALLVAPTPPESAAPAPLPAIEPASRFVLTDAGPLGCPVQPQAGRVVVTQGYGVGSHAPAEIWGAVDLAVDADGDGYAEPGASWYAPVVATHDGRVVATPDSYPGGNYVAVFDPGGAWRTGYGHLAIITVADGQFVRAGDPIGLVGSSGESSGPHLDYQVWRAGVNIDPTALVGC